MTRSIRSFRRLSPGRLLAPALVAFAILGAPGCATRTSFRYVADGEAGGLGWFEAGPLSADERAGLVDGRDGSDDSIGSIEASLGQRLLVVRLATSASGKGADPAGAEVPSAAASAAGAPELGEAPAMAGTYALRGEMLQFTPRYPLLPGVSYDAIFRPGSTRPPRLVFALPTPRAEAPTSVTAVYPSGDVLPENLLKLYLHFSAPMSRGQVWDHLRLLRATGERVDIPFLELDEELWDRQAQRLTVLIDPGRIKRGVRPLEEVGPSLEAGESYVLEIDASWEDARGGPLAETFRKPFRVAPADRASPDPAAWRIAPPRAGTRGPLRVTLDEPLDEGLLHSAMGVERPSAEGSGVEGRGGPGLDGSIEVSEGEMVWSFTPREPWSGGEHQLVILSTLEDRAGNSIGKPFEVDVFEPVRQRVEVDVVRRPFTPLEAAPGRR